MASCPPPFMRKSGNSSPRDLGMSGIEVNHLDDECSPVRNNPEKQSTNPAALQDLVIALKDSSAYSPHDPDPKAGPPTTKIDSHPSTHHSEHQLPPQQGCTTSLSRKRKYQVTTMADSPLKLRISCNAALSFGLDGPGDNPSPWDALAGENSSSDNIEPVPDRGAIPIWQRSGYNPSHWDALAGEDSSSDNIEPVPDRRAIPSWQRAATAISTQELITRLSAREEDIPVLKEDEELYEVAIRPFLSCPDEVLCDIYICLYEIGLPPIGKTTRWGFMFVKPARQPLPFQSERWKKISGVRKIEI